MAPAPDRNLMAESSSASAAPAATPITSWAIVPMTISESAVATFSQMESKVAIRAKPSHIAVCAHTWVM